MDNASQAIGKYFLSTSYTQNQNIEFLSDMKQVCNRILKELREDLSITQTVYIKRLNADLIELEST